MARARVELNRAGVKELLGSNGVRAELDRVAQRVAGRAGTGVHVERSTTAGYRGVAHVVDDSPGALAQEARTGRLARALTGGAP